MAENKSGPFLWFTVYSRCLHVRLNKSNGGDDDADDDVWWWDGGGDDDNDDDDDDSKRVIWSREGFYLLEEAGLSAFSELLVFGLRRTYDNTRTLYDILYTLSVKRLIYILCEKNRQSSTAWNKSKIL